MKQRTGPSARPARACWQPSGRPVDRSTSMPWPSNWSCTPTRFVSTRPRSEAGLIQRDERASGQQGPPAGGLPAHGRQDAGPGNGTPAPGRRARRSHPRHGSHPFRSRSTRESYARRSALRAGAARPALGPARRSRSAVRHGFRSQPRPASRPREVVLRNCPFREEVDADQDVVCAVHLGILQA